MVLVHSAAVSAGVRHTALKSACTEVQDFSSELSPSIVYKTIEDSLVYLSLHIYLDVYVYI